jgi:hypothetical protein
MLDASRRTTRGGQAVAVLIRHVRYDDFIALSSDGVRDLDGFRQAVDALVQQAGTLHFHPILMDLRRATVPPLPEAILVEAVSYLQRAGIGVANRVAIVADPADQVRRERLEVAERIAAMMGMQLRCFGEYGEALDWLSDRRPGGA